jgi:hypothetical protein
VRRPRPPAPRDTPAVNLETRVSEQQHLRLSLQREPAAGIDAGDVAGLRAAILRSTADVFSMNGRLAGELLFFGEGWTDTARTDGAVELGQEAVLAMMLRSYGEPEVLRRFRRGEFVSGGQRFLGVAELVPGTPDTWWRAIRRVGTGAANVGVFHDEWSEGEGTTLDALEEELHEWVDASKVEVTHMHRELQPQAPSEDLRMAIAEVSGTLPDHPCEVAYVLGGMLDAELLRPGPKCLLVFAFRPDTLERWEVRGKLGCPVEDLARAIAAQGPVEAMAVVHPAVVDMADGVRRRCFVTMVERKGRVGHRILPLEFDGKVARALEPKFRDVGEVPPGTGWIGVPPTVILDLTAVGPVEVAEGELPEA